MQTSTWTHTPGLRLVSEKSWRINGWPTDAAASVARLLAYMFPAVLQAVSSIASVDASAGRIPVYQPGTLSTSGSYVLTRDVSVTAGDGIVIDAPSVKLDLNGFSVRSVGATGNLIRATSGCREIVISNGRLSGGQVSVLSAATGGVTIDSLLVSGYTERAFDLAGARRVVVRRSQLDGSTVSDDALTPAIRVVAATGVVEENVIYWGQGGIDATFDDAGVISNNVLSRMSEAISGGTALSVTGVATRVTGNVISAVGAHGITVAGWASMVDHNSVVQANNGCLAAGPGAYVQDNTFRFCADTGNIAVSLTSASLFQRNVIVDGGAGDRALLSVSGGGTIIESNSMHCNGATNCTGVRFEAGSSSNTIRNNVIRLVGVPVDDLGTSNIDAGGNVF